MDIRSLRGLFLRNEEDLEIPEKVKKADIFVETKLGPDQIVKTAWQLLIEFGYSKDLLLIAAQ
jgi:hypothetical protein